VYLDLRKTSTYKY